jgi:hypothetical protein
MQKPASGGDANSPITALIDDNKRHVNVVICESDYRALKREIGNLKPPVQ